MVRIITTTREDKEFISPFIYTEGAGQALINKLKKWHTWRGKPEYKLKQVNFKKCQKDQLYNQTWELSDVLVNLDKLALNG